jgi:CRISPR-associated protein Csm2
MEFKDVLERIEGLERMSELQEEKFAPQEGIADVFAQHIKGRVKTAQLRRYFNAVKKIETDLKNEKDCNVVKMDFSMLTPQFAYARGRGLITEEYFNFMTACLRKVDKGTDDEKVENFLKFASLFEAIVAYHKYYEEKDKNQSRRRGGGRR